jgi:hypothetical protein
MKTPLALVILAASIGVAHADGCIEDVKRDALYIHATATCGTDYMDTKAGYAALAGARECKSMPRRQFMRVAKKAMLDFDELIHIGGKQNACAAVGASKCA